ncbi:hypothetical protein EVAR_64744_1 [Eumeta japonica]|uniref:Uncharacterized protein n=1 Tax=Eumeta variegata TaxID=151549 RepID=A0A4C1Z9F1_EUMVA|nr:hypothetical protein EVAR_64744_1 [Eumeta japonica]
MKKRESGSRNKNEKEIEKRGETERERESNRDIRGQRLKSEIRSSSFFLQVAHRSVDTSWTWGAWAGRGWDRAWPTLIPLDTLQR